MNCFNPLSPLLRAANTMLSVISHWAQPWLSVTPTAEFLTSLSTSTSLAWVYFQWAKCLIVNFSATMTNTTSLGIIPFHEASLIYYKCKPPLRFMYLFFFLSVYITTSKTLSHFSLTDPLRACGHCWSVLIATKNSKSASSKQARTALFIMMSTAVTFYHRNPEHNEAGAFGEFRVQNYFWWITVTKQFRALSLRK